MTTQGAKIGRKASSLIANLLVTRTIKEAAAKSGISESTAIRWMRDEDFQREYTEAKRRLVDEATSRLRIEMSFGVDMIARIAKGEKTPPSVKLSAACRLVELGLRVVEFAELERRISDLEKAGAGND